MKPRSEDDVYRELQQLLTVDPSPNFVARVRTTVANQPRPSRTPAFLIAMAVSIAAILLIAVAVRVAGPASDETIASAPRQERTVPPPIREVVSETPSAEAAPRTRVLHVTGNRTPHTPPEPSLQVMVAPEDLQAVERLVRSTEDGTVALSFDETNRKLTMTELTIAPITTEPLAFSEQQGVVQ